MVCFFLKRLVSSKQCTKDLGMKGQIRIGSGDFLVNSEFSCEFWEWILMGRPK